jgi:hypothetical protein
MYVDRHVAIWTISSRGVDSLQPRQPGSHIGPVCEGTLPCHQSGAGDMDSRDKGHCVIQSFTQLERNSPGLVSRTISPQTHECKREIYRDHRAPFVCFQTARAR